MSITPAAVAAYGEGNMSNFIAAITPGGIERQEAQGQADLVSSANRLPIHILQRGVTLEDVARATGIVFGDPIDQLFVSATLPAGWALVATEHAMHSDLKDEKGRIRAGVFYKAAFYDRKAHISFRTRYVVRDNYAKPTSTISVFDDATGQVIHTVGNCDYNDFTRSDELQAEGQAWLDANFPDNRNHFAYWAD